MSRFDPNDISPTVDVSEILLERHKVANMAQIGPQMLHDMEARTYMEHMFDRMVVQLHSYVYQHRVDTQDVRVPFSKTETYETRWVSLVFAPLVVGVTALAFATASVAMFLVACAVALAAVVVYAVNPPRTLTAAGEAVVHREQFNAFPDNTIVYPTELGNAVRVATVNSWPEYLR